jgi:diguanylate cyclase
MIATLLLAAAPTLCAPALPAHRVDGYRELRGNIEVLRDPGRSLRLEQVAGAPLCGRFEPAATYPRFGASPDGIWLRFGLDLPGDAAEWRLLVQFAELDNVCVHWPVAGGAYETSCAGLKRAGSDPATVWNAGYLFRAPAAFDPGRPLYLYADSGTLLKIPLAVGTMDAILRHDHRAQFGWGAYYGILLTAVLFALLTWVGLPQAATLYYALHLGALTLALAAWQGRLLDWGWPAWKADSLAPLFSALFIASGARFYQLLLETARFAPRVHRTLQVTAALAAVPAVAGFVEPRLGNLLLAMAALPWLGAILAGTIVRLRHGFAAGVWVLVAMALLLATVLLKALETLGWPLVDPDTSNLLARASALVPPVVLALAMALRMRQLIAERDRAARLATTHRDMALYKARFDELTHLPNRQKFRDDLAEKIAATASPAGLAVITLGLDHFRDVNHVLGHDAGDAALHEIAARLRRALGEGDLLARIGPDVFGVVTPLRAFVPLPLEAIADRCWQLQQLVHEPLKVGGGVKLSMSIGVAVYPVHGPSADLLLRHSDAALYQAKDVGGSALEVFRPEILRAASEHLTVAKDLRAALDQGQIEVYYQPILSLTDGQLQAAEALVRWKRPDGTLILPEVFIPAAEATDVIGELSEWVLNQVCRQLADWRARGVPVPRVAVNLSAKLFTGPELVGWVTRALAKNGLGGESLDVEITENALVENIEAACDVLRALRAAHVGVAMDDFGVGYSSLNYLRELPLSALKIDRSFLRGVPDEREATGVISAMISMGRELHLKVVAEGIETAAQHDWLVGHGIRDGQGYLFSPALPVAELEQWLRSRASFRRSAA